MHLHIVHGEGAAASVQQALGLQDENLVVLPDPLSVGPLARFGSAEAWVELRLPFLRDVLLYDTATLEELTIDLAALRRATVTTVWLGTGPADQIVLTWLRAVMRVAELDAERLQLVQFPPDFVDGHCLPALGFLSPAQVLKHPPPIGLSRLELATLDEAWAALISDSPDALVDFTRASIGPLPVLRQALERMLSRYPDLDSGLSRWDRILLDKASSNGPRALMVIASTLAEAGWDQDPVGDMWLYWRLRRLADTSLRSPLLELSGDASDYRKVNVRLTDAGYAVNRREVSALALNGVDDIIGGVHLSSDADRVWASDGRDLVRLKQLPPPVF